MSKVSQSDELDSSSAGGGDDAESPGEGNRAADRRYREATEKFVADGKVPEAAEEARRAIENPGEREELERAEEIGRSRAKEHDPELHRR